MIMVKSFFLSLFFFPPSPSIQTHRFLGLIMETAIENGDAKELAELIRQNPGFNVHMDLHVLGWTLLHHACCADERSAVIPLLLAHPDIDVNAKTIDGSTSFNWTSCRSPSCVRLLLKDPGSK